MVESRGGRQMSRNNRERREVPDPEVVPTAKRRHFSAEEKLRILEEADACEHGEIGALVRREGIYTSYLSRWRRERDRGQLEGLSPKKRGPESRPDKALVEENERLRRENKRLKDRLAQAETIIEVQKKVSQLLGLTPTETESTKSE
jgi:transposase-like protein